MQHAPPCSACGQPSRTSGVVRDRAYSPRWLDRCRNCFLATPPTLRQPLSQAITDIREAATEVGLRAVLYTGEDGWQDELSEWPRAFSPHPARTGRMLMTGWWAKARRSSGNHRPQARHRGQQAAVFN
jgi:hypothetical protein